MNLIWPIIIIISYIYAVFTGRINEVNASIFNVSKTALNLSLTLVGNMCLWCGIIKIIESTKLINILIKALRPILNFLYPDEKNNKDVMEDISINMVSNIIGIGNASTSSGLKAMEKLKFNRYKTSLIELVYKNKDENGNSNKLTNSMTMLVVLNTTSIQIIPTTVLSIRASLNSENPAKIIIPIWISTLVGTTIAFILTKIIIKLDKKMEIT